MERRDLLAAVAGTVSFAGIAGCVDTQAAHADEFAERVEARSEYTVEWADYAHQRGFFVGISNVDDHDAMLGVVAEVYAEVVAEGLDEDLDGSTLDDDGDDIDFDIELGWARDHNDGALSETDYLDRVRDTVRPYEE